MSLFGTKFMTGDRRILLENPTDDFGLNIRRGPLQDCLESNARSCLDLSRVDVEVAEFGIEIFMRLVREVAKVTAAFVARLFAT